MDGKRLILGLGLLAGALAGCSGSATPRLIGSFPRYATPTPQSGLRQILPPARAYSTTLEIEVADVDAAAQQAADLAHGYGGYLAASQSWYQDGRLHTSLTLAVPGSQFDALRRSVAALGRLINERLSSEPAPWQIYPAQPEAWIMVTFSPAQPLVELPALPNLGWSPARTFAQAFAVFTGIFTVMIDVLIWVGVVVGPFVLMGLGLRWLIRRAASHR
jgi:hypothetical protein